MHFPPKYAEYAKIINWAHFIGKAMETENNAVR